MDISLYDEDGQYDLNWSDIGVNPKILNTGGEKELTLSLEANSSAKAGSYFFYFNINKQSIKAGSTGEIFFKVTINYANGTVTPGTQVYKIGTEVTLTVTPDNGDTVKSVTMDGKAVRLTDGNTHSP